MEIQPLSKAIHTKCKELGVKQIVLRFSGGNDEGYLSVDIDPYEKESIELTSEIDSWAWEVYSYNGAGDGTDYGDTIYYDLENGTASHEEWYHAPQRTHHGYEKLEISKD